MTEYTFNAAPAKWEEQTLLIGISGPPGSGKTMSSLELATGMTPNGARFLVFDCDGRRSAPYSTRYEFDVEHLKPPFATERMTAAVQYAAAEGYKVVVFDVFQEHHGTGGYRDKQRLIQSQLFEEAIERANRYNRDPPRSDKQFNRTAYGVVVEERREFINVIRQTNVHVIFTLDGREKMDDNYKSEGWHAHVGELIAKHLQVCAHLPPNAEGCPRWRIEHKSEEAVIKWPIYLGPKPKQLTRQVGAHLAAWARGDHLRTMGENAALFVAQLAKVTTAAQKAAVDEGVRAAWASLAAHEQKEVARAGRAADERIEAQIDG